MQTKMFTFVVIVAGMAALAISSVLQAHADANAYRNCFQQHYAHGPPPGPANGGNGGGPTGPSCHPDGSYS